MPQIAKRFRRFRLLVTASLVLGTACANDAPAEADDVDEYEELAAGPRLGKADNAGIAGLPVGGNYAQTKVWDVENQWEDTDTEAARQAGLAWPADSGLTWDEKYSLWVESLGVTDARARIDALYEQIRARLPIAAQQAFAQGLIEADDTLWVEALESEALGFVHLVE